MKIEFFKGVSKGENEHMLCRSPLVAGEMESTRFLKYFKQHFSSQGNKVSMRVLGKSRIINSILSSQGNNVSMRVLGKSWITSTSYFQHNSVNFTHWWKYYILSLDLIPAEGMSCTSCRYLQAFSSCIDFASSMEECYLSRDYVLQWYILAWYQNRVSFNSQTSARKLGCKIDYTF